MALDFNLSVLDDILSTTDSNKRIFGLAGNDTLSAGANSYVSGGEGDDMIRIRGDAIQVLGDAGDDRIRVTGSVAISIEGGEGNDWIFAKEGGDLHGDAGDDTIVATGRATILDEAGNDSYRLTHGGEVSVTTMFGSGDDRIIDASSGEFVSDLWCQDFANGIFLDLGTGVAHGDGLGNDTIRGFDRIHAGHGNDTISGSATNSETIEAGNGDDMIKGRGGNDWIFGEKGNDTIIGGAGDDHLVAGKNGDDLVLGGSGNDRIWGLDSEEAGAYTGSSSILRGGAGDDIITDGKGDDQLCGGAGNDLLSSRIGGHDQLTGGDGADTFSWSNVGGGTAEVLDFTDGVDHLSMSNAQAMIDGAVQVGDDVQVGGILIHNFTLAQLDLTDFAI